MEQDVARERARTNASELGVQSQSVGEIARQVPALRVAQPTDDELDVARAVAAMPQADAVAANSLHLAQVLQALTGADTVPNQGKVMHGRVEVHSVTQQVGCHHSIRTHL